MQPRRFPMVAPSPSTPAAPRAPTLEELRVANGGNANAARHEQADSAHYYTIVAILVSQLLDLAGPDVDVVNGFPSTGRGPRVENRGVEDLWRGLDEPGRPSDSESEGEPLWTADGTLSAVEEEGLEG